MLSRSAARSSAVLGRGVLSSSRRGIASLPEPVAAAARRAFGPVAIATALGVAVYIASRRSVDRVPDAVLDEVRAGGAALEAGKPRAAADHFARAVDSLQRKDANPVLVLELLMRLGDASEQASDTAAAESAFRRASALCAQLKAAPHMQEALLARADVDAKRVVALARTADVVAERGDRKESRALLRSAQEAAVEAFRAPLQRAFSACVVPALWAHRSENGVPISGPAGSAARASVAAFAAASFSEADVSHIVEAAGVCFNLAHALAGELEPDEDDEYAAAPRHSARLDASQHAQRARAADGAVAAAFTALMLLRAVGGAAAAGSGGGGYELSSLPEDSPALLRRYALQLGLPGGLEAGGTASGLGPVSMTAALSGRAMRACVRAPPAASGASTSTQTRAAPKRTGAAAAAAAAAAAGLSRTTAAVLPEPRRHVPEPHEIAGMARAASRLWEVAMWAAHREALAAAATTAEAAASPPDTGERAGADV